MAKTSTGLEENIAGLLCYVLGWISGIIFLMIEAENKVVRFHAIQSIIVFGVLTVAEIIFWLLPHPADRILNWIVGVMMFIFWVVLMYKAYQGEKYKMPWAGDQAETNRRKDRGRALAQEVDGLRQRKDSVGRDIERSGRVVNRGVLERVNDVVLVDELKARVEAEQHRHDGQREHPGEGGLDVRAQHVRAAQRRDGHVGLLLGELRHRRLGLDDVALQPRAGAARPAHALAEEGRIVLL